MREDIILDYRKKGVFDLPGDQQCRNQSSKIPATKEDSTIPALRGTNNDENF